MDDDLRTGLVILALVMLVITFAVGLTVVSVLILHWAGVGT